MRRRQFRSCSGIQKAPGEGGKIISFRYVRSAEHRVAFVLCGYSSQERKGEVRCTELITEFSIAARILRLNKQSKSISTSSRAVRKDSGTLALREKKRSTLPWTAATSYGP